MDNNRSGGRPSTKVESPPYTEKEGSSYRIQLITRSLTLLGWEFYFLQIEIRPLLLAFLPYSFTSSFLLYGTKREKWMPDIEEFLP
ncbi:hypothetical protein Tco_0134380 [Tanacetum coccineum]